MPQYDNALKFVQDVAASPNKQWTIAVHNGRQHADEILATAAIMRSVPKGANVKVIRTRDPKQLSKADFVMDVGEGTFDHHGKRQKEVGEYAPGIPHSAASLVMSQLPDFDGTEARRAISAVAALDNGVEWKGQNPFSWVSFYNPTHLEGNAKADSNFTDAVAHAGDILERIVAKDKSDKQDQKELKKHLKKYTGNGILELPRGNLPWRSDTVLQDPSIKFVVYKSRPGQWNTQAVPPDLEHSFDKRVAFPDEWRGKNSTELARITGLPSAVFSHAGGFLTGWKSRGDAILAAKKAMDAVNMSKAAFLNTDIKTTPAANVANRSKVITNFNDLKQDGVDTGYKGVQEGFDWLRNIRGVDPSVRSLNKPMKNKKKGLLAATEGMKGVDPSMRSFTSLLSDEVKETKPKKEDLEPLGGPRQFLAELWARQMGVDYNDIYDNPGDAVDQIVYYLAKKKALKGQLPDPMLDNRTYIPFKEDK